MRRTATLSLFAEEKENNLANVDHLFAVNKKCILELGIVNTVPDYIYSFTGEDDLIQYTTVNYKEMYGDIVWFPLGVYVMFNPSIAHSMDGVTISMQLKDKMCLLNGDLGGQIHSAVQFDVKDQEVDLDGISLDKNPVLIYNIIKELVNHWGNESLSKIIISEVPLRIKHVVKWINQETVWMVPEDDQGNIGWRFVFQKPDSGQQGKDFITVEKNQDVGFVYSAFTYPGQLGTFTCNAGDTVTTALDKIISVIGNYEYYYDVFGNFIFHQKANYLNMTNTAVWTYKTNGQIQDLPTQVYEADNYRLSKVVYDFTDSQFITAYNNSLNYNNIKNDFVVWGSYPTTTSNSNNRIPCRFHLAIDKKPQLSSHRVEYYTDSYGIVRATAASQNQGKEVTSQDWREEIYYQMLEDEKYGTGQNTELNNTYFQYYAQLKEEFPKIYDLQNQKFKVENMEKHPNEITYFLDFIDENSELGQYSVSNIGRRAKIIDANNEGINCVFEPSIPDIVFLEAGSDDIQQIYAETGVGGQQTTQVQSQISANFATGGHYNSCFEKIKDLLYQYTHVNNTISITSLPIYYLEPNTRTNSSS